MMCCMAAAMPRLSQLIGLAGPDMDEVQTQNTP